MKTIWKYTLAIRDSQSIDMPAGAQILSAQEQDGDIQVWALLNPHMADETRHFLIRGTGHKLDENAGQLDFIDSVQMLNGALVWHLFEIS